MSEEAQHATIGFLSELCARAGDTSPPMSTHISRIFFAGDTVYKLKRAVRTAYLDFSTPELRLLACHNEFELNGRTAPSLYLGVRHITRDAHGLALDGDGETIDAIVEMRRFAQGDLFDSMAQSGALTSQHLERLAASLAAFHANAPIDKTSSGTHAVGAILATNETVLRLSFLAEEQDLSPLCSAMREAFAAQSALLNARKAAGKVRRCHGDLTLRNIAMIDGEPTPFDCLEFDEALATIDILYDLAFTLMDLWHRDRADLANVLFNRYLDAADETDGLALLPLFIAMRAVIRGHVTAQMAQDAKGDAQNNLKAEARAYVALAADAMRFGPATLIGVGGLSGSGKSTFASALAPRLPPIPGARILSSDRIRKAMFGLAPTQALPPEAYAPEVSQRVYASAREQAGRCLKAGWAVICDAVFDRRAYRDALTEIAALKGVSFRGYWLEAPAQLLDARIRARKGDPSDATPEVMRAQDAKLRASGEVMDWTTLDASADTQVTVARVCAPRDC